MREYSWNVLLYFIKLLIYSAFNPKGIYDILYICFDAEKFFNATFVS